MFWKAKDQHEKNLSNALDKFKKATNTAEQEKLLIEFINYVPDYNFIILYRHSKKLVDLMISSNLNERPANSTIELMFTMVERYELWSQKITEETKNVTDPSQKIDSKTLKKRNQERSPYSYLIKESNFFDYLFRLTKFADDRVFRIIEGILNNEPVSFTGWLQEKKDIRKSTFMNLINMVIETKNKRGANLLHRLSVSHPGILKSLEPIYIPILKKFPLSLVIDLMMASKPIKDTFPVEDFQRWLLESKNEFTMSDLEIISTFFNEIWLSETMIKMLANSKPPEKISEIDWISRKDPQNLEITQSIVRDTCNSIEKVFSDDFDEKLRSPFLFVQLYILSLSNPERTTVEAQHLIIELVKDGDPFVAASATQCLIYWIIKFDYTLKLVPAVVYRIASAIFSEGISTSLRYLYCAGLHALAKCDHVAAAIVQADENIRFRPEYRKKIIAESWCFPHIRKNFGLINEIKFVDYNQAKTVIDEISAYLSDHLDEESEPENETNEI